MVITNYILPISIFLGFLLSAIWLVFFLLEDKVKPEPKSVITKTLILGMLSAFAALGFQVVFIFINSFLNIVDFSILAITINAFIEELVKFLAVFIFIRHSRHFDEPIDRMIYMIVAGLGFAITENFFFLMTTQTTAEIITLATLRFIGATLMHALASGILGYMWLKRRISLGLIVATLVHVIFNVLILQFGPKFYPTFFLTLIAFILFYQFDTIKMYYYEKQKNRKR